ncbi:hypothetical protein K470DRAFT_262414 [Piedraia hortae CBS 480.64]|uniref:Uncharacterized protein n=1 Tax=Piedraia hortae CBS 480.64 TaxID=1314780 RepID=A0A6A7C5X8_9PEZI|nr:hypothetical protein K470DRAFT_262414 [Piedraia hortae CBS 480.64]
MPFVSPPIPKSTNIVKTPYHNARRTSPQQLLEMHRKWLRSKVKSWFDPLRSLRPGSVAGQPAARAPSTHAVLKHPRDPLQVRKMVLDLLDDRKRDVSKRSQDSSAIEDLANSLEQRERYHGEG